MNKYTLTETNLNDLISWLRGGHVNRVAAALENLKPTAEAVQVEPVAHCFVKPLEPDEWQRKYSITWVKEPVTGPLYATPQEPAVNAELLSDKKDAQRYRHLRDSKTLDQWIWDAIDHTEGDAYSKGLDAAVDAALAKAVKS